MKYPEHSARMGMLRLLHDLLEEALIQGEVSGGKLWLAYYPGDSRDSPTRLEVYSPRFDVAEAIGINGDEAYSRLRDLQGDGYLRLTFDQSGPDSGGLVGMSFTEQGRIAISKLPDPHEGLLAALGEFVAAIDRLSDVDPVEKKAAKEGAERVGVLLNKLPASSAIEVRDRISNVLGLGAPEES